jgi:hypothetical protein
MSLLLFSAPRVGFEPTTLRLTAECSTIELSRNISPLMGCKYTTHFFFSKQHTYFFLLFLPDSAF